MKYSDLNLERASKIALALRLVGIFWGFIGLGVIIDTGFSEGVGFLLIGIVLYPFGGGLMYWFGHKKRVRIKNYREYMPIIVHRTEIDIYDMAAMVGKTSEIVKSEIRDLIDVGYFTSVYIDQLTQKIINGEPKQEEQKNSTKQVSINLKKEEYKNIKCGACGGSNKVEKHQVEACEFCGSLLQG